MINHLTDFVNRKKDADRIRQRVHGRYVAPARLAGKKEVTVWADEIHAALFPHKDNYPNIHQAIVGSSKDPNHITKLQAMADVRVLGYMGPGPDAWYQLGWD